jgi:hypothetical protein
MQRLAFTLGWALGFGGLLSACGGRAEQAAQRARMEQLELEVRKLGDALALSKPDSASGMPDFPFVLVCPQPWHLHTPLGASLWTCRANGATTDGIYPQCSVSFQPQVAIETKDYFEFALNSAPLLREVKNMKDQPTKLNGADAFEATFEAELKPVAMSSLSMLVPHKESTFAIGCFAPSAVFESYVPAFRKIIDSFKFK